ncbi:MAG: ABC transporter permease [Alphaproteobacteria bacterium]|nr:ABC transporter permease [Alphaproteobacteria bacterium]
MRALDRKLTRDLWRLHGQILAIACVVGSGVAVLLMSLTTIEALDETATAYYERYRFAQVFAGVKRAPNKLSRHLADIPGVQTVETRIVKIATLSIAGFEEPVIGQLVSIPERGQSVLNRLALRAGRYVSAGRPDEVIVSEPFAEAHGLVPGDQLQAILNGHKQTLRIVGTALSPEYVHSIGPGALMPDDKRFGILWLGREAMEAAYDLEDAFNDVSLSLLLGTAPADVIRRLDTMLDRYGGVGAYERADQLSNWFLMNELEQQRNMAAILPTIFLAVAAFLANIVLARLIATERAEIGLMKAFGYRNREVGWHYAKLVIAMTSIGILLGWGAGAWLGRINTQLYAELYRFPFLLFQPGPSAFVIAGLFSLSATFLGAMGAVWRAVRLPPAEAMRPPVPPLYTKAQLGTGRRARWFDQPTRIILRQLLRAPLRSFLTTAGVAMAIGVLISSMQWIDSINRIIDVFFFQAQRQNVTVGLVEPQSSEVTRSFERMPGILSAEPMRILSATFHAGARSHRGAIQGVPPDAILSPIHDVERQVLSVPGDGLVLSSALADKLKVGRGDTIWVQVREGRRPLRRMPVVDVFESYIGTMVYMNLAALNRMLRERPSVNYVNLLVDSAQLPALFADLKDLPRIASVNVRRAAVDTFHETLAETILIYISFFTAFACTLAFGVVYNSARIALSERGRELATLRVLGFGRTEISYILLGEIAFLIAAALPLGCLAGYGLAWVFTSNFETELYRVPLFVEPATYGKAMVIGLAAAAASALLVRRRLDRLDLIAVLKTRE